MYCEPIKKRFRISFKPFQQRTAAFSDFVNITYRCHLLSRLPPLLLGATLSMSTPAFSVAPCYSLSLLLRLTGRVIHTYIRLLKNGSTNMLDLKQNIMRNQYHN